MIISILLVISLSFYGNDQQEGNGTNQYFSIGQPLKPTSEIIKPVKVYFTESPKLYPAIAPKIVRNSFSDGLGAPFIKNFGSEEGLAGLTITCALKDKKGNLWFGVMGAGVVKYNGQSFTTYTTKNGLPNGDVFSLKEDSHGNIWIGTNGSGISKFDGYKFINFGQKNGIPPLLIWDIQEMPDGSIWLATNGDGLFEIPVDLKQDSTFQAKQFTTEHGLSGNQIRRIVSDTGNSVLLATRGNGLSVFSNGKFRKLKINDVIDNSEVWDIYREPSGKLWIATRGYGLFCLDGTTMLSLNNPNGIPSKNIVKITQHPDGTLWFATMDNGVYKYDGKTYTNYGVKAGFKNPIVWSITVDDWHNLWFGTYGGGISKMRNLDLTQFSSENGLPNNFIQRISIDKNEDMWFSSLMLDGIGKFSQNIFQNYYKESGLPVSQFGGMTFDQDNTMWFAGIGGLVKFSRTGFTLFKSGLPDLRLNNMIVDKNKDLWLCSGKGLVKYSNQNYFEWFNQVKGLENKIVWTVCESKNGTIWAGVRGFGVISLTALDSSRYMMKKYNLEAGLESDFIQKVIEDRFGNIWIGTSGSGLSVITGDQLHVINTTNGLPDDFAMAIAEDLSRNLIWVGTSKGLSAIRLVSSSDSMKWRYEVSTFNESTGYPLQDINDNALVVDQNGVIWGGFGDGKVNRFDYSKTIKTKLKPAVEINNIQINNQPVIWSHLVGINAENQKMDSLGLKNEIAVKFNTDKVNDILNSNLRFSSLKFSSLSPFLLIPEKLVLPHELNSISIGFNAIDPGKPENLIYQYFLDGYDQDWSQPGKNAEAHYGNLPSGNYTFIVRATNAMGVTSELSYSFKVLPPWYFSVWAFIIYVIGFITLFYLTVKSISKQVKLKTIEETENRRRQTDLDYARKVQLSMLPASHIENSSIKIQARMVTAAEVGGDFYDYFNLNDDKYLVVLGDATGHGSASGLVVAMIKMAITNIANTHTKYENVTEVMTNLNVALKNSLQERGLGMCLTLTLIDLKTKTAEICSSGLPYPYCFRMADKSLEVIESSGLPLGSFKNAVFKSKKISLNPGDRIIMLTDGFAERFNKNGEVYGYDKLESILFELLKTTTNEQVLISELFKISDGFAEGWPVEDDMTIIVSTILT